LFRQQPTGSVAHFVLLAASAFCAAGCILILQAVRFLEAGNREIISKLEEEENTALLLLQ
jgi:hypothetical protein